MAKGSNSGGEGIVPQRQMIRRDMTLDDVVGGNADRAIPRMPASLERLSG